MIRIEHKAAAIAAVLSLTLIACDSGTAQPFKGKTDGATSGGGSDSGEADSSGTGGSSGNSGASGASGSGGASGDTCGGFFHHEGACKDCLTTNCCDLGVACSKVAECPKLAACVVPCDAKAGAEQTKCRDACTTQFLTAQSQLVYNSLVQCMGQSCSTECKFLGP